MSSAGPATPFFQVLGVRVHAVQIPDVIAIMEGWIAERRAAHCVAVTGMHGVTEAQQQPDFKTIMNSADLVVPDGMPLVWLGRWRGFPLQRRVYGPELMLAFFEKTAGKGYRHCFYGGTPGVAEELAGLLARRFPGHVMAGTFCPPFRPLTREEDQEVVRLLEEASPDVIWVGLSTPKQEKWMFEHRNCLRVPVIVGVGAAFDLNTGRVKQAPVWMREHGLEWLFRLTQEPRRLWRRYLVYGSKFLCYVLLDFLHLKKFDAEGEEINGVG